MIIKQEQFGKDHWSLLAYLETVATENQLIDERRMRCNPNTNPKHAVSMHGPFGPSSEWNPSYGTRLQGGKILKQHDDWDCKEDLIAAGFLHNSLDLAAVLTDLGREVVALLREHKQKGGTFSTFTLGKLVKIK